MFCNRKKAPPPAPPERAGGFFSTDNPGLPYEDRSSRRIELAHASANAGEAMDDATFIKDCMVGDVIPDAQLDWFVSQGFIGYQACSFIAQHWLVEKACGMPARDAVRVGYEIDSDSTEIVEAIQRADRRHNINASMREFIRMGRVFGIRVAIFKVASADPEYYLKPFNLDGVTPGSYMGISQIDPIWMSPILTSQSVSNPANMRFYEPTFWMINGQQYHHTHLCVYIPFPVSDILKPGYQYGGASIPQRIYERVYASDRTANEAPQLAMTKRLTVLKVNAAAFFSNIKDSVGKLLEWCGLRDNYGVKVVDKETEEVQQFDVSLADLDTVIMTQYQLVASIAGVPATKLLGTTPKGFNATGDYEAASYREELESIQTNDLQPLLDRHHALVMRSEVAPKLGIAPVHVQSTWLPLDSPTAAEWADIGLKKAQTAQIYAGLGAIDEMDVRDQLMNDKNSDFFGLPEIDDSLEADPDGSETQETPAQPQA